MVGHHTPPAYSQQHTAAPHSRITSPLTLHTLLQSVTTCFGPDTGLLQVTHMQRQFVRFDLGDCRNIKYVFFSMAPQPPVDQQPPVAQRPHWTNSPQWHNAPTGPTAPSGTTPPVDQQPPLDQEPPVDGGLLIIEASQ